MTMSKNIEDYRDIGLNADFCVSTYRMNDSYVIFDTEMQDDDDNWIFSLTKINEDADSSEEEFEDVFMGSFADCVSAFEKIENN